MSLEKEDKNIVVAISGASGVIYGIRLLQHLDLLKNKSKDHIYVHLIISEDAKRLIEYETDYKVKDVEKFADEVHLNNDLYANISSGSYLFDGMTIIPCSVSTLAKISCGIADNLITRCASNALKERKKLVIVPRETPLSTIHLQAMANLSEVGAIILPAMPAFYTKPKKIDELIDFISGRTLDALGIQNDLFRRWIGE
ncbi:MAG: UbiX family flavin prenyltransferase [Thermoplasmata archaeon]